jgi:hypothetical protein
MFIAVSVPFPVSLTWKPGHVTVSGVDFIRDAFRNDLTLQGGLMGRKCAALYVPPDADVP